MSDTTPHLQVVDLDSGELRDPQPTDFGATEERELPKFEGHEVEGTKAQITSVSALEIGDQVWGLDEVVKLVVEARVQNVQHKVDNTTGKLFRVHTLKALDALVLDWNLDLDDLRDDLV